jgi:hypothetical protein
LMLSMRAGWLPAKPRKRLRTRLIICQPGSPGSISLPRMASGRMMDTAPAMLAADTSQIARFVHSLFRYADPDSIVAPRPAAGAGGTRRFYEWRISRSSAHPGQHAWRPCGLTRARWTFGFLLGLLNQAPVKALARAFRYQKQLGRGALGLRKGLVRWKEIISPSQKENPSET